MKAETYAQKHEILDPHVEKMEKLNQTMKPWLSEQKYDEILKKVEAQLKKTNLSDDGQIGFGAFKTSRPLSRTESERNPVLNPSDFCVSFASTKA